jgi:hypothetical protein
MIHQAMVQRKILFPQSRCQATSANILVAGKASRILAMHYLSLVDHKRLLCDPQAKMHVLLGTPTTR